MSRSRPLPPPSASKSPSLLVARRLLHAPAMRLALLLVCGVTSGCVLYTDDLNHAPKLTATATTQDTFTGGTIHFDVKVQDPDPNDSPQVQMPSIVSMDGQAISSPCDYVPGSDPADFYLQFFRPGHYLVAFQALDHDFAASNVEQFVIHVSKGPLTVTAGTAVQPARGVGMCGAFTAGEGIPLEYIGGIDDPNVLAAGCPMPDNAYDYTWTVNLVPGSTMPLITEYTDKCEPPTAASGPSLTTSKPCVANQPCVCVWPDFGMASTPSSYDVALAIDNGVQPPAAVHFPLLVEADSPPCITDVDPAAGSYVVDPADPRDFATLTVGGVTDDLDSFGSPQLTFAWSMWRDSDPTWRAIDVSGNQYSPDFSSFAAGEHVRIRAEAIDRTMARASCDPAQDDCVVTSCFSNMCHKWMTWDLELR